MKYNIATSAAVWTTPASQLPSAFPIRIPPTVMVTPAGWCGEPRPSDPLLAEAIDMARGAGEYKFAKNAHAIPDLPRSAITFIHDEATCERAALAYQAIVGIAEEENGSLTLSPVLVIKLGGVFAVEAARPRGELWEVAFFDRNWNNLGWGYGAGQ
jgi:hypothetical protein